MTLSIAKTVTLKCACKNSKNIKFVSQFNKHSVLIISKSMTWFSLYQKSTKLIEINSNIFLDNALYWYSMQCKLHLWLNFEGWIPWIMFKGEGGTPILVSNDAQVHTLFYILYVHALLIKYQFLNFKISPTLFGIYLGTHQYITSSFYR